MKKEWTTRELVKYWAFLGSVFSSLPRNGHENWRAMVATDDIDAETER
jgi:hypothetical protein